MIGGKVIRTSYIKYSRTPKALTPRYERNFLTLYKKFGDLFIVHLLFFCESSPPFLGITLNAIVTLKLTTKHYIDKITALKFNRHRNFVFV